MIITRVVLPRWPVISVHRFTTDAVLHSNAAAHSLAIIRIETAACRRSTAATIARIMRQVGRISTVIAAVGRWSVTTAGASLNIKICILKCVQPTCPKSKKGVAPGHGGVKTGEAATIVAGADDAPVFDVDAAVDAGGTAASGTKIKAVCGVVPSNEPGVAATKFHRGFRVISTYNVYAPV
uniref:Uncharacterized protein n=1 Tax=Romanomermis culicivorax TaxID=13658 RepID=A0A915K1F2_ROMCU